MDFLDYEPFNSQGERNDHSMLMNMKPTLYQHVDYFMYTNRKAIAAATATAGVMTLGILIASQIDKRERAKEQMLLEAKHAKIREAMHNYYQLHGEAMLRTIMPGRPTVLKISDDDLQALKKEYEQVVFTNHQDPNDDLCGRLYAAVHDKVEPIQE